MADPRVQHAEVVVDLGDRPDRRARVLRRRLLVDRDRRREPLDEVDVGLLHLPEELARVRRQRLDVPPLALRVDRVERERGLPGPGQAREHDQLVPGELERDVPQVVLPGAVNHKRVGSHPGHRTEGSDIEPVPDRRSGAGRVRPMGSPEPAVDRVPFRDALRFWVKLGFVNFGGPTGQIALMHTELVERRRWLGESRFLHALNFAMLLPGPEAHQLAIYAGWLLNGTAGRPGRRDLLPAPGVLPDGRALLDLRGARRRRLGLGRLRRPRVGGRRHRRGGAAAHRVTGAPTPAPGAPRARSAFLALFVFGVPFPLVVLGAGLVGWVAGRALATRSRRARRRRPCPSGVSPTLARTGAGARRRARRVADPARAGGARGGNRQRAGGGGRVLLGDGARHVRRRVRRARVREPGRRAAVRVAHVERDGRRAQPGRDHAGTADPGRRLRRVRRGVPRSRVASRRPPPAWPGRS